MDIERSSRVGSSPASNSSYASVVLASGPTDSTGGGSPNFGTPRSNSGRKPNNERVRIARVNNSLPRSQGWSLWLDPSGTSSEETFDNNLRSFAECSSSAQFHEKWCQVKRESVGTASIMVRVFRAGVLPFSTLSKNRDGGEFRCELNPGISFVDAASCFAAVAALLIDGDLCWHEGMNGVCLVYSTQSSSVQLWSGSAKAYDMSSIDAVLGQLNTTPGIAERLRSAATFKNWNPNVLVNLGQNSNDKMPSMVDPLELEPAELPQETMQSAPAGSPRGSPRVSPRGSPRAVAQKIPHMPQPKFYKSQQKPSKEEIRLATEQASLMANPKVESTSSKWWEVAGQTQSDDMCGEAEAKAPKSPKESPGKVA